MKRTKIIAVILSAVMLLGVIPAFASAQSVTRVLAGSDYQHPDGNDAGQNTVNSIIGAIKADGIDEADGFIFCGDYDHDLTMLPGPTSKGVQSLTECVNTLVPAEAPHVYVQGNHDSPVGTAGLSFSGNNDPENGKYGVFVINEDDYSWFNTSREVIEGTANNLRKYLNEKLEQGFKAPVFVVTHLPLHYSYRSRTIGDGRYCEYIFKVLNEAGAKGLNIIFLFGHDHSNGWDDYLGGSSIFLKKGDEINICKLGNQFKWNTYTLNFTYMNAGYTGYYDNHNGADDALTMTLFEISDSCVIIRRYDESGLHTLGARGETNRHKNEKGYAPNTQITESPYTLELTEVTDNTPIEGGIGTFTAFIMNIYEFLKGLLGVVC